MNENYTHKRIAHFLCLIIQGCVILVGFLMLVSAFVVFNSDYSSVITFLLQYLHAESYRQQFETRYFTENIFHIIPFLFLLCSGVSVLLFYLLYKYKNKFRKLIGNLVQETILLTVNLFAPKLPVTTFEKGLLFSVVAYILAIRIILSGSLPFHIDEMHSWLYFVDKGPLVSLSYYPSPNNHVLFSLLCCITDIFTDEPLLIMRITSVSVGILCSLLVFRFILQYADFSIALLGMLLFSFAPVVQNYSVLARGYMLETFFFIIAFWSFIELVKKTDSLKYQIIFVFSSVLASLTLITYLYAMVGFGIAGFYFFVKDKNVWAWVRANVVFLMLLILLYTPLLMFSGVSSIAGNSWILRAAWPEYFSSLGRIYETHAEYFISIEKMDVFLFPLLTFFPVWYLRNSPYRFPAILSAFLLVTSFVICIAQRLVPYERMWTHFLFCQQAMLAFCIAEFQRRTQWKLFWLFSKFLIVLVAFSYPLTMVYSVRSAPNIYNDAAQVSTDIMKTSPEQIYCQEYVYYNYLSVYARQYRTGTVIDNEGKTSHPDFVILESKNSWPEQFNRNDYSVWRTCDPFVCIFRFKR